MDERERFAEAAKNVSEAFAEYAVTYDHMLKELGKAAEAANEVARECGLYPSGRVL